MKKQLKEIHHYFRVVLGEISVKELIVNRELSHRAELLNHLFMKSIY